MKYRLRLLKGNMAIRADHGTRKNGIDIARLATLTDNTTNLGDVVWPCLVDGEQNYLNAKAGDSWLHITVPREGWVAIRHNGETLCELIEVEETPAGNFPDRYRLTDLETGEYADYERRL
jgi:hypothetical protein